MSDQSPQRRFQYWVGVYVLLVVLLTVLVAVPVVQASPPLPTRRGGPMRRAL